MAHTSAAAAHGDFKPEEKRVIFASSLGTVFEWYDFYLYAVLAPFFAALFFPPGNQTAALLSAFAAYAAGFLVRPFGALLFGRIGDLVGRKYTFLITIVVMGASTFAVGLLPTYAMVGWAAPILMVTLRLLQGLALGGEYGGAATYVAEHVPDGRRGFYTSFLQTTATLGLFVALAVIGACRLGFGAAGKLDTRHRRHRHQRRGAQKRRHRRRQSGVRRRAHRVGQLAEGERDRLPVQERGLETVLRSGTARGPDRKHRPERVDPLVDELAEPLETGALGSALDQEAECAEVAAEFAHRVPVGALHPRSMGQHEAADVGFRRREVLADLRERPPHGVGAVDLRARSRREALRRNRVGDGDDQDDHRDRRHREHLRAKGHVRFSCKDSDILPSTCADASLRRGCLPNGRGR